VIADADVQVRGMRMIEVPEVLVGGHPVGPVWFTERANESFHDYMSRWMYRSIEGALGGSALRYFQVTLDYPAAVAHFVPGTGDRGAEESLATLPADATTQGISTGS
jgi:hypothetical protein